MVRISTKVENVMIGFELHEDINPDYSIVGGLQKLPS